MAFPDSTLAHRLLDGLVGIEIGGSSHNPFNLRGALNVDYSASMQTPFKEEERKTSGWALPVDVVAWGDDLPFDDESLDYVVSSHVLEHFYDPIKAIREWLRVVRPGGYVYMVVPHKERTGDSPRPRTTLAELLERHAGDAPVLPEEQLTAHHSVWITADVVELCRYLGLDVVAQQDVDDKVGNGFTVVVKKPGILHSRNGSCPVRSIGPLDIGCGQRKRPGYVGVDILPLPGVEFVADVMQRLPFEDGTVTGVSSTGTLHLLPDPAPLLRELIRVCKDGAEIEIWTPHARADAALLPGSKTFFTDLTWLHLFRNGVCDGPQGHLAWEQAFYLCYPAAKEMLEARGWDLNFAVAHVPNAVAELGVRFRVRKAPRNPAEPIMPEGRFVSTARSY